uniref:ANK_REP_REGION domain-containing protein n=1 Tax=Trichuris muris TaxID=70415 RepID=A0A5S6QG37_TRIMR
MAVTSTDNVQNYWLRMLVGPLIEPSRIDELIKWKIPTVGGASPGPPGRCPTGGSEIPPCGTASKQKERILLEAAYKGDKASVEACLQASDGVDVNCTDLLGRTALEISVDNENVEIVELLLKQPGVKVCNALLYAIREGVFKMVEMILNHHSITAETLGDGWSARLVAENGENFEYASDISPIILAAHLNQFEILQLLLSRGAVIRRPHTLSCSCKQCHDDRMNDSLLHSLRRINTYRALASPAWISFTSSDPVLTAFRLSWELQRLSDLECEFKEFYWELSEQCKKFACDLLSQCRSSEEVVGVLNKDVSDDPQDIWSSKLSLARLRLALKYEIKQVGFSFLSISFPHIHFRLLKFNFLRTLLNGRPNGKLNLLARKGGCFQGRVVVSHLGCVRPSRRPFRSLVP